MKPVLATIAGLMVAALIIFGIESLSTILFPLPEGADPTNLEWLEYNMDQIPTASMIIVAFAHLVGVIIGMIIAANIARTSLIPSYIVAVLLFTGTVANLLMIPHPAWFMITDVLGILVGIGIGRTFAKKKVNNEREMHSIA